MMEFLAVLLAMAAGLYFVLLLLCRRHQRRHPRARMQHRAGTLAGKAYVTDGDGVHVAGQAIRFGDLDTPEWDQVETHRDSYWFRYGKHVKSTLIQEIGGKRVRVTVEDYDKFGRAVGIVTCKGKDIGEWLVREGHAIAAYSDRYANAEREARRAKRGMWSHAVNVDPRQWPYWNTWRGASRTDPWKWVHNHS